MGRKPITMAPRMLLAVFVAGVALACAIQPSFEVGAARLERDTSFVVSNLDVKSFVDVTEAADVAVVEAVATLLKSDVAAEAYTAVMEGAGASATCGDGMRQGTEECDDGNTLPNDGGQRHLQPMRRHSVYHSVCTTISLSRHHRHQ